MRNLRRADWEGATLEAIADGGLSAVHIDEIATRLGVTKGSFYWHYASRDELIAATLAAWREGAVGFLDGVAAGDAAAGKRVLAAAMLREPVEMRVEIALAAVIDDERVTPFVEAVSSRRVALFESWFGDGALMANAIYVGYLHAARIDPARRASSVEVITRAWSAL